MWARSLWDQEYSRRNLSLQVLRIWRSSSGSNPLKPALPKSPTPKATPSKSTTTTLSSTAPPAHNKKSQCHMLMTLIKYFLWVVFAGLLRPWLMRVSMWLIWGVRLGWGLTLRIIGGRMGRWCRLCTWVGRRLRMRICWRYNVIIFYEEADYEALM